MTALTSSKAKFDEARGFGDHLGIGATAGGSMTEAARRAAPSAQSEATLAATCMIAAEVSWPPFRSLERL